MPAALVTRTLSPAQGGIRLKKAAGMAEAGEIRDLVAKVLQAESQESHDVLYHVCSLLYHATDGTCADNGRKLPF